MTGIHGTLKKETSRVICHIIDKTQSVTANTAFESIDLTDINGNGSDTYEYDMFFICHYDSVGTGYIHQKFNSEAIDSFTIAQMYGTDSIPGATYIATNVAYLCTHRDSLYPTFAHCLITGETGNNRHLNKTLSYKAVNPVINKRSEFTQNTADELTSMQLLCTTSGTLTYTLIIVASPKIQYNPNAILLENIVLSSYTGNMIFGGVNDTMGYDTLNSDTYDYYITSNVDSPLSVYINEDTTTSRTSSQLRNSTGTLYSEVPTLTTDTLLLSGACYITGETGDNKITTSSINQIVADHQIERFVSNPNTTNAIETLLISAGSSTTGSLNIYAVPRGKIETQVPWKNNFYKSFNGDISGGIIADIPEGSIIAKVTINAYSTSGSDIEVDFDSGYTIYKQNLKGVSTTTSASSSTTNVIGNITNYSNIEFYVCFINGYNRPIIGKSFYSENTSEFFSSWVSNTSNIFNTITISASNSNTIIGNIKINFF